MSHSIMGTAKESYLFPHSQQNLEKHHIFFGNPKRRLSEEWGCWCWLTTEEHRGTKGVHNNRALDLRLKAECQQEFESLYGHEKFMEVFGRNYL